MAGPSCAQNSHYEVCIWGCQSTCTSLYAPVQCSAQCQEGCVCDEGYVLSSEECVPISQCGCIYQGLYYKAGETFQPTCQEQCVCQASGDVSCKELSCGPNEECKLVDGIRKCHPVGSATCSAAGDPHYLSFDGVAFDFQGTCTYILTKTCTDAGNLTSFSVKVENVPWGNGKVSVTKMVSVEVYGLTLTLLQNKKGLVMVSPAEGDPVGLNPAMGATPLMWQWKGLLSHGSVISSLQAGGVKHTGSRPHFTDTSANPEAVS